MIKIRDLNFQYQTASRKAVENISLDIQKGEFVLITGPSGCGKSSLVRTLNGLIPHFHGGTISGQIIINNMDVFSQEPRNLAQTVGFIFQNPDNQLLMHKVENEIAFGLENLAIPSKEIKVQIDEILKEINIRSLKSRSVIELSGGEKQKVAIASIMAMKPDILILDEPTAELDPEAAEHILQLIKEIHKKTSITVLLIEHRIERVIHFVDRVLIMEEGMIKFDGTPKEVFRNDLSSLGIGIPPYIRLFKTLNSLGFDFLEIPLNINEAIDGMKRIVENLKPNLQSPTHLKLDEISHITPPLIELSHISFEYSKNKSIINDLSFVAYPGEFISIIGHNGAGKTTFLKLLNGLLRPIRGAVMIDGKDIKLQSIAEIAKGIGFIFQNPSLQFYQDSVEQEFRFILTNLGIESHAQAKIIAENLAKFDLEQNKTTYPRYLSWGEQQKAALASVLMVQPKILLLDEPTHGMDYGQKIKFLQFLDNYRKAGNLIILVSHDLELVAEFSDRVLIMENGMIQADGQRNFVLSNNAIFQTQIHKLIAHFPSLPQNINNAKELIDFVEKNLEESKK